MTWSPSAPVSRIKVADREQVAGAVAYLLSPESAHIALHDMVVDGGEAMGM